MRLVPEGRWEIDGGELVHVAALEPYEVGVAYRGADCMAPSEALDALTSPLPQFHDRHQERLAQIARYVERIPPTIDVPHHRARALVDHAMRSGRLFAFRRGTKTRGAPRVLDLVVNVFHRTRSDATFASVMPEVKAAISRELALVATVIRGRNISLRSIVNVGPMLGSDAAVVQPGPNTRAYYVYILADAGVALAMLQKHLPPSAELPERAKTDVIASFRAARPEGRTVGNASVVADKAVPISPFGIEESDRAGAVNLVLHELGHAISNAGRDSDHSRGGVMSKEVPSTLGLGYEPAFRRQLAKDIDVGKK